MHPYSVDTKEHTRAAAGLALVSAVIAWLLWSVFGVIKITPPWWLEYPSVLGVYGLLWRLMDTQLWKLPVLRRVGAIRTPNLNGEWDCTYDSSWNDSGLKGSATVKVRQTWTRLSVVMDSQLSRSRSTVGAIAVESADGVVLIYEYVNEPKPAAHKDMHAHRGTCLLRLDGETLTGEYYTGRDRKTHGSISMQRRQSRGR